MKTIIYVEDPKTGGKVPAICELTMVGDTIKIKHEMKFIIDIKIEDIKMIMADEQHG